MSGRTGGRASARWSASTTTGASAFASSWRSPEAGRGLEQKPGPERIVRVENKLVPPRQKRPPRHLGNDPGIRPEPCFLQHASLEDTVPAQDALDGERLADRHLTPRVMHGQPRGNAGPRGRAIHFRVGEDA